MYHDYQLGLELSYSLSPSDEYASSPSFVSACSSSGTATSSSTEGTKARGTMVMMHDPYSFDAIRYAYRLSDGDIAPDTADDDDNESDGCCSCAEESPTATKVKKSKKKNIRCPNGHRAAKRLRYRKGQSHYSCNECTIRWKVDDPKRRPQFELAQ